MNRAHFNSYQLVLIISFVAFVFGDRVQAQDSASGTKAKLILTAETTSLSENNVYDGIAYSDSGNQLMSWDREGNIRIYEIDQEKLVLKKKESHAVGHDIFWYPDGISFHADEKKCVWYPSLEFYHSLIHTSYVPPSDFSRLRAFLEKCRHINSYTSAMVKEYCQTLECNDFSGVSALAYDARKRLIPIISSYNAPTLKIKEKAGGPYRLIAESLDMNTLAYSAEDSFDEARTIIFFRHLKHWKTCSIKPRWAKDGHYRLAPCCLSPEGNLACIVLYKFPSYGRHIGASDWFKSAFQSSRRYISVIIYDVQNSRILFQDDWTGFSGETERLIWRAAFCQDKREFALLNGITGTLKIYRY